MHRLRSFQESREKHLRVYSLRCRRNIRRMWQHMQQFGQRIGKQKISVSGKTKATLISVVLHSSFSKTENELFVGHTGVLVPTKNHKYLFIEKLSFQLPYQVTRFESKKQLNDYLMGMYDTEWGRIRQSHLLWKIQS